MKTELFIVGTAGSARDCANYALDAGFSLGGFIVPTREELQTSDGIEIRGQYYPLFEEAAFLEQASRNEEKPCVLIPIGNPTVLARVVAQFRTVCIFPNLIHPSAQLVDTSISMGMGNVVGPNCVLTTNITMGDFNYLNIGVTVGHDVRMGDFNVFNPKVSVSGNITIGEGNLFGANSSLYQGIRVGNGNTVGMGSAVLKEVEDNGTLLGVPARRIM